MAYNPNPLMFDPYWNMPSRQQQPQRPVAQAQSRPATAEYSGPDPSDQIAQVLRSQWDRYSSVYSEVEGNLIESLDEDRSPEAAANAQAASLRGFDAMDRVQDRYGVASTDDGLTARLRESDTALAGTSAYNQTQLAQIDRRDTVRRSLVATGQGLLNQATGGLSTASGLQSQRETVGRQVAAQQQMNEMQLRQNQYAHQQQQAAQRQQTATSLMSAGIMAAAMFF